MSCSFTSKAETHKNGFKQNESCIKKTHEHIVETYVNDQFKNYSSVKCARGIYFRLIMIWHPDKQTYLTKDNLIEIGLKDVDASVENEKYIGSLMTFIFKIANECYHNIENGTFDTSRQIPKSKSFSVNKSDSKGKDKSENKSKPRTCNCGPMGHIGSFQCGLESGKIFHSCIYGLAWFCGNCGTTVNAANYDNRDECPRCEEPRRQGKKNKEILMTKSECKKELCGLEDGFTYNSDETKSEDNEHLSKDFETYLIYYQIKKQSELKTMKKGNAKKLRDLYLSELENFEQDRLTYPEYYSSGNMIELSHVGYSYECLEYDEY